MQLIWVLVSTNDVLNNWIIMVLRKCKKGAEKREHRQLQRALETSLGGTRGVEKNIQKLFYGTGI